MHTNKKPAAGGNRQAGNICTFNTPDYKQIACKINALLNLLALEDAALLALLALILWGALP
jgi:hypothetical protein